MNVWVIWNKYDVCCIHKSKESALIWMQQEQAIFASKTKRLEIYHTETESFYLEECKILDLANIA